MKRFLRTTVFLFLLSLTAVVAGRDIFVDNLAGDDHNNGQVAKSAGKENGPCKSIARALYLAEKGDHVILVANPDRPYRECITLQGGKNSGYLEQPFEIVGNGAVLDGSVSLEGADWQGAGPDLYRLWPRFKSFQQLFLDGQPAVFMKSTGGKLPNLLPDQWTHRDGAIYFHTQPRRTPESYAASCAGHRVGITLYDVHDVLVRDLTVRGYALDGVNAHDTVTRADLIGLTCTANGRSGISIGGACRVRVDTCVLHHNLAAQIRTEGFCQVELIENKIDAATAPAVVKEGGQVRDETNQ